MPPSANAPAFRHPLERLRAGLSRLLAGRGEHALDLRGWRHNLLNGLCAATCVLGLLVCPPSAWYSAQYQHWGQVGADVVSLVTIVIIHFRRDIPYRIRAAVFLAAIYLLAVALLFSLGAMTQIYLLAVPVLCTVLLGSRAAIAVTAWTSATLFTVGYFGGIDVGIAGGTTQPALHWTILTINFALVAAVLVLPCAYLIQGLDRALARQRAVQDKLEAQITMLQAREAALRDSVAARKAAEESNELKSEFLAMISHEVRTPLGGVIGMLRLAKKDAGLAPDTRNKLRIGLNNAEVLLQIINDILDFSRLEAGRMPIEAIDFDLPALLRDVHALLNDRAETKGVSLLAELDPTLAQWWHGDPTRLRQVVMNLVGNGIKFTERGEVCLRAVASPGGITLTVRDTGIGIAPEAMDRLFRMFEQGSAATSRKYGGTGLGLAICKYIVNAMHGRIDVRSAVGAGTEFTVFLPLLPGQPVPDRAVELSRPHARQLRILCAEDGSTNQIILRELLTGMGHAVDIAEDGQLALDALEQQAYDLLILDSRMPRMDGLTALRRLRATNQALPVLALTANATPDERARFLAAGANGFLAKPIEEFNLHEEIGRLVGVLELDALFGLQQAAGGALPQPAARKVFKMEGPRRLAAIRHGIAEGDAAAVSLHAHTLLGCAGLFAAGVLGELCARIEAQANAGQLDGMAPLLAALEDELAALLARID